MKRHPGTKIGITTTIPVEIIFAAHCVPVDLNNIFISDPDPERFLTIAEDAGYPRNICSWIKGMYGVCQENPDIKTVISVVRGDCSNTQALMETLVYQGVEVIPFAYPYDRDPIDLKTEISKLMNHFDVDEKDVEDILRTIRPIRRKLEMIDRFTWDECTISGKENHEILVQSSDFNGNLIEYERNVDDLLNRAAGRSARIFSSRKQKTIRLGILGVPPIILDLHDFLADKNVHVVYNETQRQFSMPGRHLNLVDQYRNFTYPYDIFFRLEDIKRIIAERKIDGLIHYTQSFCFRQIEDIIIRKELPCPILSLEGERPQPLDARTKIRLETFIEMLGQ